MCVGSRLSLAPSWTTMLSWIRATERGTAVLHAAASASTWHVALDLLIADWLYTKTEYFSLTAVSKQGSHIDQESKRANYTQMVEHSGNCEAKYEAQSTKHQS
ncbi:hypothetical protein PoB_005119400 [Plakobranchus ocellatus]|uniref:Uncharacterized protein n=1 Tax=Plakobranchus ocellatus TaxID=259542 RepID=A0AAV4C1Y5_9GAST|nr:hypothetical protein PoB_005119400 [Plakobranchus ocellatus]